MLQTHLFNVGDVIEQIWVSPTRIFCTKVTIKSLQYGTSDDPLDLSPAYQIEFVDHVEIWESKIVQGVKIIGSSWEASQAGFFGAETKSLKVTRNPVYGT